ncbi:MAG TPA: hypothetical protein VKU41_30560 [Polyangiaceae bacterium]|nr:hypothetical protein [Polyangiaceae bacterium]
MVAAAPAGSSEARDRATHPTPALAAGSRTGRAWGEFLLAGGITPLLYPLSWLLRRKFGIDGPDLAVGFLMFHAAFVINDPHFTVTYCLFYRGFRARAFGGAIDPWQRARYVAAGVVAPVVLAAWGAAGLASSSPAVLGALIQGMFLLVGWHYVKQGFGAMIVLSARRGVRFTGRERLALLAHCLAGWAYAWASPADLGTEVEEKGVVFVTWVHPVWLERLTLAVLFGTAAVLLGVLVQKWRREGPLPILTPLTAMLCSVWAWSIYSSIDPLVVYVVPALHSVQYLYFVWLLRGNEAREREGPPWFDKPVRVRLAGLAVSALVLGWLLFHGVPSVLDDLLVPRRRRWVPPLGSTPYLAFFYTFVNIHHFVMDAVLWRRENSETRYLSQGVA